MNGDTMKRSELNIIILKKIDSLDETDNMKDFLKEVLSYEKRSISNPEIQTVNFLKEKATEFSKKEQN